MPGAQPKRDPLQKILHGLIRGSSARGPGSGKVR
jgi:hypothetical protein